MKDRKGERGITILLVAVSLAFIVITFAALAIDLTALYTARGEARQAADAAALAGAKVLANSGFTSDPSNSNLAAAAQTLATQIATSVATNSSVGGRQLLTSEVTVSFPNWPSTANPQLSVLVRRQGLATFFSKIWGIQALSVSGSATAEAYNPGNSTSPNNPPIAPQCAKPWIIPNLDNNSTNFFNTTSGNPSPSLVGEPLTLTPACNSTTGCSAPLGAIGKATYYPASFLAPIAGTLPNACITMTDTYPQTIAACTTTVLACNSPSNGNIDLSAPSSGNRNLDTYEAANCLINPQPGQDQISVAASLPISTPPEFLAGSANPLVGAGVVASGAQVTTSNSIVTVPVFDQTTKGSLWNPPVSIIGFVQLFIVSVDAGTGVITANVLNISACGSSISTTLPPVLGDGVSPVPVRLIGQ